MKRFYSIIAVIIAAVASFAAYADDAPTISFTLKVNDPANAVVTSYGSPVSLEGETTVLTCSMYTSYTVTTTDGYFIESVECEGSYAPTPSNNTVTLYPYDGYVYTIKIVNLEELRTASFTVTTDDPSKFSATLSGTNKTLDLQAGTQTIKFAPSIEGTLSIRSYSGSALYKVTLDDVNIPYSYGYGVQLSDGCAVGITAEFPDEPCDITFTYTDPKGKGFWTRAVVNDAEKADFDGEKLTVKLGDRVMLYGNTAEYKYGNPVVNGVASQYFYGTLTLTPMENTEIEIDAHPYGNISFTLNIDNPANLTVIKGGEYNNQGSFTDLVAGNNSLTISENIGSIYLKPNSGCFISSVTDQDGNTLGNSVSVTDGMTIYVTTGAVELDACMIVWVDDPSAPQYYFGGVTMQVGEDRKNVTLAAGYNEVDFVSGQNNVNFGWAGAPVNRLYLNGVEQIDPYQSYSFYLDVANDDVIKIFLAEEPVEVAVKLTAEGKATALAAAEIKRDIVTALTDWQNTTETVFNGTRYTIKGDDLSVKFNGADVAKGDDGEFVVTIPADADNAEITVTGADGIDAVAVDSDSAADAVFNLQGVCVGTRATVSTLPAGLYIVGSAKSAEKILVK